MPAGTAFVACRPCGHASRQEALRSDRLRQYARGHFSTRPAPSENCYSYILLRPKDQRATAVQARLKKADQMAAAFDSRRVTVDLVGDHANILSLQFPVVWPAKLSYSDRVSSVVEDYFASPDVQDYMCNSGFAEVRLSAAGP